MNIDNILNNLSKRRQLFHSEADFQFELAWQFKLDNPKTDARLEKPYTLKKDQKIYMDLLLKTNKKIGIELKYKTQKFQHLINEEKYDLTNHSATNLGRYDFLHDVARLENLKSKRLIDQGFVVFLTNTPAYWNGNSKYSELSQDFYISEGISKHGSLKWISGVKESSIGKQRMAPINLKGHYSCHWQTFSKIESQEFKFLVFKI
jgi:hypothetical protein